MHERTRRPLRRLERGAVMIEAVMVSMVLAIAFAGGIFFHGLFAAKMKANRDARLDVWTRAIKGCSSKLEGEDTLLDPSESAPLEEVDLASPPGFFQVGHVDKVVTSAPVRTPSLIARTSGGGPGTFSFSAHHQIACNDQLQGEKDSIFKKIGAAARTIVGKLPK
ncbi:MAG TPA: hypothetical protein VH062_24555 [Polyangiaceae bacterium]|nr:hypothetical protein [Polyangiaceae bacterium]